MSVVRGTLEVRPLAMAAIAVAVVACGGAPAPSGTEAGASKLALATVPVGAGAAAGTALTVTSPAFVAGADIPLENTQYRGNVFPGVAWTGAPAATKSFALIMQDGDALRRGEPILHWVMIDIPATVTTLDAGMTTPPAGALYGPNYQGAAHAYSGPRTPQGPKHRYHFQVFALDTSLGPDALASYQTLIAAMQGRVLASGELVGLGHAP